MSTKASIPVLSETLDKEKSTLKAEMKRPPEKGRNVSGRSWKVRPQKRASSLLKTSFNNARKTYEERQTEKRKRQEIKELQAQLQEEKRQAKREQKERRLENERRRQENELKTIERSMQTLRHDKVGVTLKAMSKKQLRQIKKSQVNVKTGVVEYVPAYANLFITEATIQSARRRQSAVDVTAQAFHKE